MKEYKFRMPKWENQLCAQCGDECDTGVTGVMFCWPCRREDNINHGIVVPLFAYGPVGGRR